MPKSRRPDGVVAGSTKRLASQFYQIGGALPLRAVPTLDEERAALFFCSSPLFIMPVRHLLLCNFLDAHLDLLGQAWAGAKGELATCRHRADSGQETDCK